MPRHDMNSVTLGELLDDPEAVQIIDRVVPGATSHPLVVVVRGLKATDALAMAGGKLTPEQREALVGELGAL
ncbi:MAG TPA: hypothetical protein VN108_09570 [Marmoricola sp.]|nr:hypothetical protein [Marmoricola sp.]